MTADVSPCSFRLRLPRFITPACAVTLALVLQTGCDRPEVVAPEPAREEPRAASLAQTAEISPAAGLAGLTSGSDATLASQNDRIMLRATGTDPHVIFAVRGATGHPLAVAVDFESPVASTVQLFYQIENVPFSGEHAVSTASKAGRNRLLFQINDPRISGWLRFDPGQSLGDYAIRSITVFSNAAIAIARPDRPQAELAAAFTASTMPLFAARTPQDFGAFTASKEVKLNATAEGLSIEASGSDPSLLLPEFDATKPAIAKLVIVTPAATTLQIFHKRRGDENYTEANSRIVPVAAGENTVYFEHVDAETTGAFRLDPGNVPGAYLLKEVELRAADAAAAGR